MAKIRVLLVDDSVVFRRLVGDELSKDPAIEVVGAAANGKIALAKMTQVNPDLVILDIEMPEMNGLTTLKELRKIYPRLPIIMFSSLTERGASETLEALSLGASDYFTKPNSAGGLSESLQVIRDELIPEIKALCGRSEAINPAPALPAPARPSRPTAAKPAAIQLVAIGASTGGPNALAALFAGLPKAFPVPIVIVQHMPPMFTRMLAERLTAHSALNVREATDGCVLEPGAAWVAPGDYHMVLVRDALQTRLRLNQDPQENSCRPAVDVLFRSAARTHGAGTLAVVMTGMGQDGLRGCEDIHQAGGQILAQDEQSSVVWGMPGFVVRAGLADRVMPLSQLSDEIVKRVRER